MLFALVEGVPLGAGVGDRAHRFFQRRYRDQDSDRGTKGKLTHQLSAENRWGTLAVVGCGSDAGARGCNAGSTGQIERTTRLGGLLSDYRACRKPRDVIFEPNTSVHAGSAVYSMPRMMSTS